ncbi:MAG: hypothetical protein U0934_04635 [Pseudotabrizicola sp.]|uniref:hypothetical protein n=1 Tax=Pseudotabrizicola sp. TaxID=2939647 RepID=UPI002731F772|nr:hypothetical protein [Pseudotabrizicola sp.]MDP2082186.1 hypothetical protein [Pseudotabrizicola sp.]MDZ7573225.1 hypothetical protein [Pseudotabrizicola sp.]
MFIEARFGRRLSPLQQADVLAALSLDGENAAAFMTSFAAEFGVDLTGYEPRFHHRDEQRLLRPGWPFPAPHLFGVRLPIAVSTLAYAAQTGRWPVTYPVLSVAASRQWLNAPLILFGLPVLAALVIAVLRWI